MREVKFCSGCQETKSRSEFCGKSSRCRKCKARVCAEWRKDNPGYKAAWRKDHPDKERAYRRQQQLKREYGISIDDYNRMFEAQLGLCGICGRSSIYTLHVDHDHHTEEIRGLLCKACNRGLGMFKDDLQLLQSAIQYLSGRRYQESNL